MDTAGGPRGHDTSGSGPGTEQAPRPARRGSTPSTGRDSTPPAERDATPGTAGDATPPTARDATAPAGRASAAPDHPEPATHTRRGPLRLIWRTLVKSWNDSVLGKSAETAFWQTLALPPLLLGLIGSLGYVVGWFGQTTTAGVQQEIRQFSGTIFTDSVVNQIIDPTINDVLNQGRGVIVSFGFVLSLWAGSSGIATLVDAITEAHNQHTVRNYLWQRTFSILIYLVALLGAVLVLPLLAIGPSLIPELFPASARGNVAELVDIAYYPTLGLFIVLGLSALYKVALPNKLPWHRALPGALLAMLVFLVSSAVLRVYIRWITSTGYTYGTLATPIAFLLFLFFIALAILLGAQFNHAIGEMWPMRTPRRLRRRWTRLHITHHGSHNTTRSTDETTAPASPNPPGTPDPPATPDPPGTSDPPAARSTSQPRE